MTPGSWQEGKRQNRKCLLGEPFVFCMKEIKGVKKSKQILFLPSKGQTLALAEPEARLYNHPTDPVPPSPVPKQMFVLAVSQPFLNGMS